MAVKNPLISVIVPAFNVLQYFPRCIESVLDQSHENLEIIVVDDGSSDGSSDFIDEYAKKDSRIIAIHQTNQGVSSARNRGLKVASGDYYHFPDADDFLELDTYEYCLGLMRKHKCDAVNFEHYVSYSDKETAHVLPRNCYGLKDRYSTQKLLCTKVPFACNKIYSAKLVEGLAFREDIARGEDGLFAHQALLRADRVWFDERPLYHYIQNSDSACRGAFRESQLSALKLFDAYDGVYSDYSDLMRSHISSMENLCITLYCDMWLDSKDWSAQQNAVYTKFCDYYEEAKKNRSMSFKSRVKYSFFRANPSLFCKIHKRMHSL